MKVKTSMVVLRFNYNPLSFSFSKKKRSGLRIGQMEASQRGFYLNSLKTGITPEALSAYLLDIFHSQDGVLSCESLQFLLDEGDRTAYTILLPYLLSTDTLGEFETIIRDRFFGVERFISQGKNIYNFLQYIEKRKEPMIWMNDLERGIIGWDMGQLVGLARAAKEKNYITKEQTWEYIEKANILCSEALHTSEQRNKSYLIGQAMKLNKIEEWERLIQCYTLVNKGEE